MNILLIGAHPDDFEFGCGGSIIKLKQICKKIVVFVATKGEFGAQAKTRSKEQELVCKYLSAELVWGGLKDTRVTLNKELIDKVESLIKKISPDIIFVNYYEDTHQDHRNIAQATITATRYSRNVLFYETPTSINFSPTVFIDIGDVLKKKLKLLKLHKSQVYATRVKGLSIIESAISTAIFRGYQTRVKYAEGFQPLRLSLDFWLRIKSSEK